MSIKFVFGLTLASASTLLGQGTVRFDNDVSGSIITHVYMPNPIAPSGIYQSGNGPSDYPPGSLDWDATFPSGSRVWQPVSGSGFSAQLWAAPGGITPDIRDSMRPASPVTTFRTGADAGFVLPTTATLEGIPADAPVATLELRVWDNKGGLITRWEDTHGNFGPDNTVGRSALFEVRAIGGAVNPPPTLSGLKSFNLLEFHNVPEPSSFALLGLGAAAILRVLHKRQRPYAK